MSATPTQVTTPTLKHLKTEVCTLQELQSALVQLIEMHNGLAAQINKLIYSGRIQSESEARRNTRYGL